MPGFLTYHAENAAAKESESSVHPVGPKSRLDYNRRELDFGTRVRTDDIYNSCFEGRN